MQVVNVNGMTHFWARNKSTTANCLVKTHVKRALRDFQRSNYLHFQELKRKAVFLKPCNNFTLIIQYQDTDEEVYTSSEVH